jgi:hypothetical protein
MNKRLHQVAEAGLQQEPPGPASIKRQKLQTYAMTSIPGIKQRENSGAARECTPFENTENLLLNQVDGSVWEEYFYDQTTSDEEDEEQHRVVCKWINRFTTHVASVEASLAPDLGIIVSGFPPPKPVIISNKNKSQTFGRAVALLLQRPARDDDIFEATDGYAAIAFEALLEMVDSAENEQVKTASPLSVVEFVNLTPPERLYHDHCQCYEPEY